MKKAALIYLSIILVVTGVIAGIPMDLISLGSVDSASATAPVVPQGAAAVTVGDAPAPLVASVAPAVAASVAQSVAVQPAAPEAAAESTSSALAAAAPASGLLKPVVRGGDAGLEQTTSAILAELNIIDKAELPQETQAMRSLSSQAISGLRALPGAKKAELDVQGATLESIVADALKKGTPDGEINALVNAAAGAGKISVPSALVTSDGKVDTNVLLASLVSQAQIAAGKAPKVDPGSVLASGAGVEIRVTQNAAGGTTSHQFYTVLPGDSLGAIAKKFYGDVVYYPAIFDANRTILSSPDRLNVGQRLVIPQI